MKRFTKEQMDEVYAYFKEAPATMSAERICKQYNETHPNSRPISLSTAHRIRSGRPAFAPNDADQRHINYEEIAKKMSVTDLLGLHKAWIDVKIPEIVQKAIDLMEKTEEAVEEVCKTMEAYEAKILVVDSEPMEKLNTDHLMDRLMSLAQKLQKSGGGRLPQQAVPGIE